MEATGSGWHGCLQHLDVHCLRCGLAVSEPSHAANPGHGPHAPDGDTDELRGVAGLWPETVGFLPGVGSPELPDLEEPESFYEVARLARLLRCLGPVTLPPSGIAGRHSRAGGRRGRVRG